MAVSYLQITVAGETIGDALLGQVVVEQRLNRHWTCRIILRQTEDSRFAVEDAIGRSVTVKAFNEDEEPVVLFDGLIRSVALKYEVYGS